MKFTKDALAALSPPPGKADHFEWDDELPGFGVRLRGNSKRWVVQYRAGTRQRRESLGDVRRVKLDDARKIARQRFARVELGSDPAAERAAAATRLTFGEAAARYLDAKRETMQPESHKATTRYLNVSWKPLHGRALDDIKRPDVAARLQELAKLHGRTAAARARDMLAAMFSWSMREGLCEANPVIGTNDPAAGILPRDRVLTDDEIRIVWNACGDDDAGCIVRLLLLTGCRREEIGSLKRAEISLDTGLMIIPGERTKNGRTLTLPLPPIAVSLITEAIATAVPERTFIFGRGDTGFSGWSAAKLRLDARIVMMTGKTLPRWTFHDLRRTMRTGLGMLGIPPHVGELAVNHVKGGVQATYDRYRYQREIGAALALWAEHLDAVFRDRASKVVALRA
jgi:integrase